MCTPPSGNGAGGGGGIEPPTKFSKWGGGVGGLTGSQLWGFTKKFDFRGVHEKPIYRKIERELSKKGRGAETICKFKRVLGKKEGVVFLRGG